jgi:hypothetical protein
MCVFFGTRFLTVNPTKLPVLDTLSLGAAELPLAAPRATSFGRAERPAGFGGAFLATFLLVPVLPASRLVRVLRLVPVLPAAALGTDIFTIIDFVAGDLFTPTFGLLFNVCLFLGTREQDFSLPGIILYIFIFFSQFFSLCQLSQISFYQLY